MPSSGPEVVRLRDLQPQDFADTFAQLIDRRRQTTRDGKPYFSCRFRDADRIVTFMAWLDGGLFEACEKEWRVGRVYRLRVVYGEHERYGPQLDIRSAREVSAEDQADGFDPAEFQPLQPPDRSEQFGQIRGLVEQHIVDEPLRQLVLLILDRHGEALKTAPGSERQYYPYPGGWVEHTLNVMVTVSFLAEIYRSYYAAAKPPLNKDLLLAGAVLHDIGRAVEFLADGSGERSVPGHLFGHISLARDMVREAARDVPNLNPNLLQLLDHLIQSHLNHPEWGSPRLPAIPESLILHHLDDLDAKLEMYLRCIANDPNPGPFTDHDPVLYRRLFKGREI